MSITDPQEKFAHLSCRAYAIDTQQQIQNLGRVFSQMGQEPGRITNQDAQGITADGQQMVQEAAEGPLRECLISNGQLIIEHLEIPVYTSLVQCAQQMGQQEVADLPQQNLEQEQQTAQSIEQMLPQLDQQAMQTA